MHQISRLILGVVGVGALTLGSVRSAFAQDMVSNGTFTGVTYSEQGTYPLTTLYGQFGSETGSTLTVPGWTSTGYNYVFAPGTADQGVATTGANTGQPEEAPGQYNVATGNPNAGYGDTYLWGTNNGGLSPLPATDPAGGNFIAADGAYEVGAISQTFNGLVSGHVYAVTFWWAGAQQQNFTGITTEQWRVNLGTAALTSTSTTYQATSVVTTPSHSFSGWMQTTLNFTATSATEVLSFLANGTPSGEPPFSLLGGVSMIPVPEPTAVIFIGLAAGGLLVRRWQRRGRTGAPAR